MPAPKGHAPYSGCETGGRPKKYTPKFIEAEAKAFLEWMQDKNSLWYEDFAAQRGYSPQRLTEFSEMNEKFSEVYARSQAWQKSLLIRGGLLNKFNSSITKLVLANTCGWTDKAETKLSGDALNPLLCVLNIVDGGTKELINEKNAE
jgi:hypothetical protein